MREELEKILKVLYVSESAEIYATFTPEQCGLLSKVIEKYLSVDGPKIITDDNGIEHRAYWITEYDEWPGGLSRLYVLARRISNGS